MVLNFFQKYSPENVNSPFKLLFWLWSSFCQNQPYPQRGEIWYKAPLILIVRALSTTWHHRGDGGSTYLYSAQLLVQQWIGSAHWWCETSVALSSCYHYLNYTDKIYCSLERSQTPRANLGWKFSSTSMGLLLQLSMSMQSNERIN